MQPMIMQPMMTRRRFAALAGAGAALLGRPSLAQTAAPLLSRAIPRSGEAIPAVGLGTAALYNVADADSRRKAGDVVAALVGGGGRLIDTASTYGDAEIVIGDTLAAGATRDKVFLATKLEAPDAGELQRSLARLKTAKLDLLQLHNVRDPKQNLERFFTWRGEGICRYVGITSTFHGAFSAVEAVLLKETPDFLQVDYSLDDREAEKRLLPVAAETRTAVLTALPFGRGRLFAAVRGKSLPDWAAEFGAQSWAQFFLKFLLGDARVTAVIPGTADAKHMLDNLGAARGPLPDAPMRKRMVDFLQSL
jgi:aryl-alcohol dehydrogenase-like predicted oxidoreductase